MSTTHSYILSICQLDPTKSHKIIQIKTNCYGVICMYIHWALNTSIKETSDTFCFSKYGS